MGKLIPITQIGKFLDVDLNPATCHRWRITGVLVNGQRIRLPATRYGARYYVSESELTKFIAMLNSPDNMSSSGEGTSAIRNISQSTAEADQLLDEFGI